MLHKALKSNELEIKFTSKLAKIAEFNLNFLAQRHHT